MFGPVVSHLPCDLGHQARLREAGRSRLARAIRRGRRGEAQEVSAEAAEAAVRGSEDVWRSLRF